jgi:hypothetical protein
MKFRTQRENLNRLWYPAVIKRSCVIMANRSNVRRGIEGISSLSCQDALLNPVNVQQPLGK